MSIRLAASGSFIAAALVCSLSALAQTPFTIRQPPDGATVRETVSVKVPLASIPVGGYVVYSIDGKFVEAIGPTRKQIEDAKRGQSFVFHWDTKKPVESGMTFPKENGVKDGIYTISATLFVPSGGSQGVESVAQETSSIKVRVRNRINPGNEPIVLRYHFRLGEEAKYKRNGSVELVGSTTTGAGGTGNRELIAQQSNLDLSVDDLYRNDQAIVRNKLTALTIKRSGQQIEFSPSQLTKSLYQQLDPLGNVLYQTGNQSFEQFAQLGLPVNTSIDLPVLPQEPRMVGDVWTQSNVPIDIPGTPPNEQPKVTLQNKLVDLEWQGGYPTAKIVQTYNGTPRDHVIFGTTEIESPHIKFQRVIYLAYRSGTLVKVYRTLQIQGKLVAGEGFVTNAPGMTGAAYGGGMVGPPMGAEMGALAASGYSGAGPAGAPYMSGPGMPMKGNRRFARRGFPGAPYGGAAPGFPGMMMGGRRGAYNRRYPTMGYGAPNFNHQRKQTSQITLKSSLTTELTHISL